MTQETEQQPQEPARPTRFELGLFALIVLSCSQVGYSVHPRHGPHIAAADVLCVALFLAWALRVTFQRRWQAVVWPPPAVWAWLVVGLLSVSMAVLDAAGGVSLGQVKAAIIQVAQIALYFGAAYMMFVNGLSSTAQMRRACAVLLGAVTVVVAWGLMDYLLQPDPMEVKAGFATRNIYSGFLLMTVPLLLGIAVHERSRQQLGWVAAVGALAVLTMLGPPHVWLLAGVVCWIAWVHGGRMKAQALPVIIASVVVVSVALPRNHAANVVELLDIYEREELFKLEVAGEQAADEAESESAERPLIVKRRWLEWQPALMMMADNLPLGVGAGNYQTHINEAQYYGPLPNVRKIEPDTGNFYLIIGATMGLAGLICVIALLAWFWNLAGSLWLRANSRIERGMAAGLHGALVGIITANIFSSLFVRGVSIIWALVFAMITVAVREGIAISQRREAQTAARNQPPE